MSGAESHRATCHFLMKAAGRRAEADTCRVVSRPTAGHSGDATCHFPASGARPSSAAVDTPSAAFHTDGLWSQVVGVHDAPRHAATAGCTRANGRAWSLAARSFNDVRWAREARS